MVSVIIPVYNGEKYINTIINCFERQKYKKFELVFVNDGSKDNSLEELNIAKNNSSLNITVIDQLNAGVSAARNVGIKNAEGDFICFCDVDDEVTVNYISDMRSVLEKNDVDLVICKHQRIRTNGLTEVKNGETGQAVLKSSLSCLKDFLYGRIVSGCCTTMTRKEIIKDNNLRFAEGYKYSEDLHMLWRIMACAQKIAYLDKHLYLYKVQPNSAMSRFNNDRMHGYELMRELESFFDQKTPEFAAEYRAYGAAKIMWSITWQAAINLEPKQFTRFLKEYNIKGEMRKLISFKNYKVSLSSMLFIFSPPLFRYFGIKLGEKHIR